MVRPLSEMQNCREFKPLHPGSWAQASKIWFWTPVSRVQALYILPLCGWGTLGSWSSPGLFGGPWTCLGCLGCVGLPGALLGSPWGSPGAPWAAAVAPWGSGARSGLLVTLAFGCLTYLLLVACCLSFGWRFDNGFLAFGRWQVGPLVVGRVGGWVRWLLVGLGVGSLG